MPPVAKPLSYEGSDASTIFSSSRFVAGGDFGNAQRPEFPLGEHALIDELSSNAKNSQRAEKLDRNANFVSIHWKSGK